MNKRTSTLGASPSERQKWDCQNHLKEEKKENKNPKNERKSEEERTVKQKIKTNE